MGQRAQLAAVGQAVLASSSAFFLLDRRFGRLARAQEAPGQHLRQCVEQRAVHGAFLLLQAPAPRLQRQLQQRREPRSAA
ncbi:hypothetical protein ALISP_2151 [Alicycliphilus sp. B1]|nr:hypothetical protein ALISP_2151 [Alicycliphilus sp. B1]